jgi:hypothetical protein
VPSLTSDEVMRRVQVHVPACPVPTITLSVIDTVYDFFDFTLCYQPELDSIATVVDQPTYPLVLPAGYVFGQAMSARLNHIPVEQKSADQLDLEWPEMRTGWNFTSRHDLAFSNLDEPTWREAVSTQPRFFHFETDGSVRLVGIPQTVYSGVDGFIIKAALKPNPISITSIDDAIWNDCYQTLIAGVVGRLMRMPSKAWTDQQLAGYWEAQYGEGREDKRAETLRGVTRNDRQNLRTVACA